MRSLIPSEHQEQCTFVAWLRLNKVPFYSVPNGFVANPREGAKLKRSGLEPGVPDICVPVMRGKFGGLYVELKRKAGGMVSAAQNEWINYLNGAGYLAVVCNGADFAIKMVEGYLNESHL